MMVLQSPQTDPAGLVPAASGLAVAADIAMIAVAVALFLVMLVLLFAVFQVRKGIVSLREAVGRLEPGSQAVLERARGVSENVEAITRSLRGDVDALTGSVQALSDRLHQASDRMEERVEDFNALMEVVQEEAEGIFIGTASAVRGLRGGAEALSRRTLESADLRLDLELPTEPDAPEPPPVVRARADGSKPDGEAGQLAARESHAVDAGGPAAADDAAGEPKDPDAKRGEAV